MIEKHMWRPVNSISSAKPSPRWGHSCCVIQDELVLFGGYADSVYMNDVWVYNTYSMQWIEIKTFGNVPLHRSNSSLHYDGINNRVIMFGGGGSNKARYNTIHILDWNTKIWTEVALSENQTAPWERTYHSSQLLYPYLVVYGGEGVADLDDLWVFHLETMKWKEIVIEKKSTKPCGRRFHSSCLIGNQFYVIAGCYSKYRPLSDVWSIDLTNLIKNGSVEGMEWKEIELKNSSFLTRWGHACASLQNKIYIFGGRFSNDLNDVLVLDMNAMKIRTLKAASQSLPKPRRRACINFIGNCMVMFGGFNSDYFNDLHFINVSEGFSKPKRYTRTYSQAQKILNIKQTADIQIYTNDGQAIHCHKAILMQSLDSQQSLNEFRAKISRKQSKETLLNILQIFYRGHGKLKQLQKYHQNMPASEEERESKFLKTIEKLREKSNENTNIFMRKNILKVINNNIIELSDVQFGEFLEKNRENLFTDIQIVINDTYVLKANSILLSVSGKFFKNLLNKKYGQQQNPENSTRIIHLTTPNGNIVLLETILNFLMLGFLIIPESMSLESWIQLYELTDYLALPELKDIIIYSIWCKIEETTVDSILDFCMRENLNQLALACARFKIKNTEEQLSNFTSKFVEEAYNQNKFQIKQKMMAKQVSMAFKKKISTASSQGEKENYQLYNQ